MRCVVREALSWKPVAAGRTYCSPACGYGCTLKMFNDARQHAQALAVRLALSFKRDGAAATWEPRVWENLGWHYEVTVRGISELRVYRPIRTHAAGSLPVYYAHCGQHFANAPTPEAAVLVLIKLIDDEAVRLHALSLRLPHMTPEYAVRVSRARTAARRKLA